MSLRIISFEAEQILNPQVRTFGLGNSGSSIGVCSGNIETTRYFPATLHRFHFLQGLFVNLDFVCAF